MAERTSTLPSAIGVDLRDLAAHASTLDERIRLTGTGLIPTGDDPTRRDALLARWRQMVGGDEATFARRLAWDGFTTGAATAALAPVRFVADAPLPSWAETLRELLDAAPGAEPPTVRRTCLRPDRPLPFEDILAPLVGTASAQLAARVTIPLHLITDEALGDLERSLLERLTRLCAESLYLAFTGERARTTSSLSRLLAQVAPAPARARYDVFRDRMLAGGFVDHLAAYPALARLIATVCEQWVGAVAEFLHRLAADHDDVVSTIFAGVDPGPVLALHANLSDPHNNGRSTLLLRFGDERKLIYKPRDLMPEATWFTLLDWLNAHGAPLPLARLPTVQREGHGWVGYAEYAPCAKPEEATRYYRRTGMLLCLVYVLGGNDCHFENIIANGEQPILVDLETIMHPVRLAGEGAGSALDRTIGREKFESVIRTGLLPQWIPQPGGRALDTSALGAVNETQTTRPQPVWREVNTDAMRLERVHMTAPAGSNAASLDGAPLSPNDFVDEIVDGFRGMYACLRAHRATLLAPGGPMDAMRSQRLRFIFRGTGVYYAIAERANRPEGLRDGAARSIELDALARAPMLEREQPRLWPLLAAERAALERGDIPLFLIPADGTAVITDTGEVIPDCFEESCIASLERRLARLDDADLARQVGFIRATMQARVARHGDRSATEVHEPIADLAEPGPSDLVADALAIADRIRLEALGDPASGVAWMTARYHFAMQRFQLEVSGPGLYDGGAGVGLFFAALEHVTNGGAGHRDLALGAVVPLRRDLRGNGRPLARESGIGGASGTGSFVYGLTRMGTLLGDEALLDDALRAARLIGPEELAADRAHDVVGGAAGAILGLLALHDATGDADALDRAVAGGNHLLAHRTASPTGHRAWATSDGKLLCGFAHGAAGIAYALLRLAGRSGIDTFREAAIEAIAFEDTLFSDGHENWPDLRPVSPAHPEPEYAATWCNGGAGIGLARLGGLGALDTPQMRHDVERAADVILREGGQGVDHLCCGNLGRADILLEMGLRLDRDDLVHAARIRIANHRQRAHERGDYRLWWETGGGISVPGLFQGTSGIGYALLRAAVPDRLPSVLLWA